jgi:integrase
MVEETSLVSTTVAVEKLNNTAITSGKNRVVAIARAQAASDTYTPHISLEEVWRLCQAVESLSRPKFKERNQLIIQTLFDGCLRVSELLALRPQDIVQTSYGWQLRVWSQKMKRWETCSVSATLVAKLESYAYRQQLSPDQKLFPINRSRVFQIIDKAFDTAGIAKPGGVGTVHILRHSGALERLQKTRNPQAVQEQLRHTTMRMTLRYMKTLAHDEALAIQSQVDLGW